MFERSPVTMCAPLSHRCPKSDCYIYPLSAYSLPKTLSVSVSMTDSSRSSTLVRMRMKYTKRLNITCRVLRLTLNILIIPSGFTGVWRISYIRPWMPFLEMMPHGNKRIMPLKTFLCLTASVSTLSRTQKSHQW